MPTFLTAFGECKTLLDWAHDQRCIVSLATLLSRVKDQWDPERALTEASNSPADRWRQPIAAFGLSKSLLEWELDERAQASAQLILSRLRHGWQPEAAITTPAPSSPKAEPRAPKTYCGKTLSEWMRDPRCQVSRYTLERNFRARLPLEEALVFRRRKASPVEFAQRISTVEEALALLAGQGELWYYMGGPEPRVSLLVGDARYDVVPEAAHGLEADGLVRSVFSTDTIRQYALTPQGAVRAKALAGPR